MRNTFLLLLVSATLLIHSCSSGNCGTAKTPEEFGKAVFTAIQQNDWDCYNAHTMTEADARSLIQNADVPAHEKQEATSELMEQVTRWNANSRKSFDKIMEEAREEGIDWSATELTHVESEHELEEGVHFYDIMIFFTHEGKNYGLKYRECYDTDNGIRFNLKVQLK